MERKLLVALLLALAPLGCGEDNGNPIVPPDDGMIGLKTGTLQVSVAPMERPAAVAVFVDKKEMSTMEPGKLATFTVPVGVHAVQVRCDGYGYAVPGFQWSTMDDPVTEWVAREIEVTENAQVAISATLCRDLTGRWNTPGAGISEVTLDTSRDGRCFANGFSPFGFEVLGDRVSTNGADWIPLLNEASRIEYDANGDGVPDYIFTRVE
ncbi:hypothetical protein HY628_02870 [Candidatus Uhrbacteria bacterium]|nr:hypothetical protein [Candidatus Uhrbacteria bacterium]